MMGKISSNSLLCGQCRIVGVGLVESPLMLDGDEQSLEAWEMASLISYDEALAAGRAAQEDETTAGSLGDVHECQRLLELLWPRLPSSRSAFGRFLVQRELGRGGFGVVFLAEDTTLGRKVALKLPRPEILSTPEARRRFLREGEAAARLDHPNIVPVYEVGEEGTVCFIASAYCEGIALADWLRERAEPVSIRQAAVLIAKLASAVGHAHERGIVHRDLKPSNILLQSPSGDAGRLGELAEIVPRICDFGLAKILDADSNETRSGVPLGSPAYMAPEQAAGQARSTGPAADVYSLGAILYELLAGRPPFQGETALETIQQVTDHEPPALSVLRPGVPRDLDTICTRCLEKRPERRYANGSELAEDLGRFLEGRPVKARPISGWVRAGKLVRRHPVHAALALVVSVTLLAIMGGLEWSRSSERRHADALRKALDRAQESERRAQAQTDRANERERLSRLQWAGSQITLAQTLHDQGEIQVAAEILESLCPGDGQEDVRGFAWHYLDRLCRRRIDVIDPRCPFATSCAALAPDGRNLVLGDSDGQVWLLDVKTARYTRLPGRLASGVGGLHFSPDGRTLLAYTPFPKPDDTVKLWDVGSGEPWLLPAVRFGRLYGVVFSPDGRMLTTVEASVPPGEALVRIWGLAPGARRAILETEIRQDQLLTGLPHVLRLTSGDSGNRTSVPPTDAIGTDDGGPGRALSGLAISQGGARFAVESGPRLFGLFDTPSGHQVAFCLVRDDEVCVAPLTHGRPPFMQTALESLCSFARELSGCSRARLLCADVRTEYPRFSRDGRKLAFRTAGGNGYGDVLRLVDTATGELEAMYQRPAFGIANGLAFTPAGRSLLLAGDHKTVVLWHFENQPEPPEPKGHPAEVWSLAYSPNGRILASGADDHTVKLWDAADGRELATLAGHGSLVTAVAFSPDGSLLASASFDRTVRIWDVAARRERDVLEGHSEPVRSLAFSPDGETLVSCSAFAVAFSPDGTILATTGRAEKVRRWDLSTLLERPPLVGEKTRSGPLDDPTGVWFWDARTGKCRDVWDEGPQGQRVDNNNRLSLAFSPHGQTLAVATSGGKVLLRDWAKNATLATLQGPPWELFCAVFSPDGRTLATAGRDKSVRLCDPHTGQELLVLNGHRDQVHTVAFSPDGRTLASGSFDGAIKIWRSGKRDYESATQPLNDAFDGKRTK